MSPYNFPLPITCGLIFSLFLFSVESRTQDDASTLLLNVTSAPLGSARPIAVVGPKAIPLLFGNEAPQLAVVAAAVHLDKGRVVVFGHDSALNNEKFVLNSGTGTLLLQAVQWCQGKQPAGAKPMVTIGVRGAKPVQELLKKHAIPFIPLGKNGLMNYRKFNC